MIGAILLGLFCGIVARMLVPGDAFRNMSGPKSWLVSLALGLAGALVGYLIFTVGLGIGDTDIFDWGGVLSALIGTVIVLVIALAEAELEAELAEAEAESAEDGEETTTMP